MKGDSIEAARGAVVVARRSVEAAEDDHRVALAALEVARAELGEASDVYDRNPTDDKGRLVLRARDAAGLAELREQKARKRAGDAAAALEAARAAVARLEAHAVMAAARTRSAAASDTLRTAVQAAHAWRPAPRLASVVEAAAGERVAALVGLDAAERRHQEARAALLEAEDAYSQHDAGFAESLPAWRESSHAAERERLERLASVEYFRADIRGDTEIIGAAVRAMLDAQERIEARWAAQHVAAERARETGASSPALDSAHRFVHVLLAVALAVPDGMKISATDYLSRLVRKAFQAPGAFGEGGPGPASTALQNVAGMLVAAEREGPDVRKPALDSALLEALLGSAGPTEGHAAALALVEARHEEQRRSAEGAAPLPPSLWARVCSVVN